MDAQPSIQPRQRRRLPAWMGLLLGLTVALGGLYVFLVMTAGDALIDAALLQTMRQDVEGAVAIKAARMEEVRREKFIPSKDGRTTETVLVGTNAYSSLQETAVPLTSEEVAGLIPPPGRESPFGMIRARCFYPHHAFIIEAADGSKVELQVCFSCNNFRYGGPPSRYLPPAWRRHWKALFRAHGMH